LRGMSPVRVGNGRNPIWCPAQLGCCSVAPLRPHRAERRSMSLDTSGPQRMIRGTSAIGALCRQRQFEHSTHSQQHDRRSCSRGGGVGRMPAS